MSTSRRRPKRLGPEWWALYAAAFVHDFDDHLRTLPAQTHDKRLWTSEADDSLGSCIAERAAAIADRGIECFHEAVESEAIKKTR